MTDIFWCNSCSKLNISDLCGLIDPSCVRFGLVTARSREHLVHPASNVEQTSRPVQDENRSANIRLMFIYDYNYCGPI
jgi:hypothetical protein